MKVNFGILGCGRIAERHAKHINEHSEAELVAVYDIKKGKSNKIAKEYDAIICESFDELVSRDDIDIINICTPNGIHFEGAIGSLEHNKHVLVEKPMALKKDHCEQMINLALKKNKQLFVVKQNRFNPPIAALHELMQQDKIGKLHQVSVNCFWNRNKDYYKGSDWKGTKELDGGTLFTQFSHFIDIVYYLFGDIENINGVITNAKLAQMIEFEDTGNFTFSFKNGGIGSFNYTTTSFGQNMEGSITLFAEKATIKIGGKYLNVLEYQKTDGFDIENLPVSGPANDYGFYQGSMSNHDKVIHNVVEALNGRENIMTNAFEGLKTVEIIENVYNSVKWIP